MKQVIDIKFFKPDNNREAFDGVLTINGGGKNYLETQWTGLFNIESIPVLYGCSVSGEKYTLVNCIFSSTSFSKTKYNITELYKGNFLPDVLEPDYKEAEARISGLTGWINENRIELKKDDSIATKEDFIFNCQVTENIALQVKQFAPRRYEKNEVYIGNSSLIRLTSVLPESRLTFYEYTKGFMRFLLLFTDQVPGLKSMNFTGSDGKSIEWLLRNSSDVQDDADGLLQYRHLGPYLDEALRIFYADLREFTKVLDLFAESIRNHTAETSFLNLTAAFEIFHKSFLQVKNEPHRTTLIAELITAGIVNNKDRNSRRWMQVVRYYDLLKSMSDVDFVKTNFANPAGTAGKITDSRNYYTHWEDAGDDVWSANELFSINNELRILLRGTVLNQLKLPPPLISKLMNNRAALFYYSYEKNKFSIHYKK